MDDLVEILRMDFCGPSVRVVDAEVALHRRRLSSRRRACGCAVVKALLFCVRSDFRALFVLLRYFIERKVEPDSAEVHPAGLARSEHHLPPLRTLTAFEIEDLSHLHFRHHRSVRALLRTYVGESIGITDDTPLLCRGRMDQTQAKEGTQDRCSHVGRTICLAILFQDSPTASCHVHL